MAPIAVSKTQLRGRKGRVVLQSLSVEAARLLKVCRVCKCPTGHPSPAAWREGEWGPEEPASKVVERGGQEYAHSACVVEEGVPR